MRANSLFSGFQSFLQRQPRVAWGAVWLLGEPMHWNLLAGLALVTGGILFGVRQAKPAGGAKP
ncbi:MAG: hypothetical protein ACOVOD_02955 [Rhodoferax sp.]